MAKSKSDTTSKENKVHSETNGDGSALNGSSSLNGAGNDNVPPYGDIVEQAKEWVEQNQTAAMLSGFGFGVFIGVLLRR